MSCYGYAPDVIELTGNRRQFFPMVAKLHVHLLSPRERGRISMNVRENSICRPSDSQLPGQCIIRPIISVRMLGAALMAKRSSEFRRNRQLRLTTAQRSTVSYCLPRLATKREDAVLSVRWIPIIAGWLNGHFEKVAL